MSGFAIYADRKDLVRQLLEAKQASGKTYTEIAKEVGLTNLYTAQLFQHQVHSSPSSLVYLANPSYRGSFSYPCQCCHGG